MKKQLDASVCAPGILPWCHIDFGTRKYGQIICDVLEDIETGMKLGCKFERAK
jgi:hypothetical protein